MSETRRLHYYQRQLLGEADFTDEQTYHRSLRRRHNLGPHEWGVITGLTLVELDREGDPQFCDVVVMPGLAIDLFGREILVMQPTRLDPSLFAAFSDRRNREVWIGFLELAQVNGGMATRAVCQGTDQFARVQETFQLFAGPQSGPISDLSQAVVTVGGDTAVAPPPAVPQPGQVQLPPDGSVPFQTFEAPDAQVSWLVRLGSVLWDGTPGAGKFRRVGDPADLTAGRTWAGLVGASLRSESGALAFGPRVPFADVDAQDFATVEGRLAVEGRLSVRKDVRFLDPTGADGNIPLWLQRTIPGAAVADGITTELNLHIGDDATSKITRFSVGAGDPASVRPAFAVRADGRLDAWNSTLHFTGDKRRQAVDLSLAVDGDGAYGIGTQNGAEYTRSAGDIYWYHRGVHDDAAGNPGAGGSVLLQLDGTGRLLFGTREQQMLNLWAQNYGFGIQDWTLYARSDADFCWFRGGAHSNNRSDPGGGTLLLKLDQSGALNFGTRELQMLNLWAQAYGLGVQDLTLYARSDADFCWFRGGAHSNNRSDPGGGTLAMKLDQSGTLSVSRDIRAGGALFSGANRVPLIDVQAGVFPLDATPGPGNTTATAVVNIDVTTRLDAYATASIMVGLSDISNVDAAFNARWRVEPEGAPIQLAPNRARFPIRWQVDDTDGWLRRFSWVAIFTA